MTLEVINRYSDKYTHETVYPDTILEDVPKERAKELIDAGVAIEIKEKKTTEKK